MIDSKEPPVVFISYSHDDDAHRAWVLQLAARLRANGVDVILDQFNTRLGSDLATFMERGLTKSNRVICICSKKYVEKANAGQGGAGYEKQILTAPLVRDQNTEMIIPIVRANEGPAPLVPTFLDGRKYLDMREDRLYDGRYEELLRDVLEVPAIPIPPIGPNPFENIKAFSQQKFLPSSEKYHSPSSIGKVTFDYGSNSGRYSIGLGELLFTLYFSNHGSSSVHFCSDAPSVRAVALAIGTKEINEIKDARVYNYTSRVRQLYVGQVGVVQNNNGFYAAIKVHGVKHIDPNTGEGEIVFDYVIQTNGSVDFSNVS